MSDHAQEHAPVVAAPETAQPAGPAATSTGVLAAPVPGLLGAGSAAGDDGEASDGSARVRRGLSVGSCDDPAEHEADAVARRVVRALAPPGPVSGLVRAHGEAGAGAGAGQDGGTASMLGVLRRRADGQVGAAGGALPEDHARALDAARGGGRPLPDAIRRVMEPAMGADLSAVRTHEGAVAKTLSEGMQAKAFTIGRDVFFRDGMPDVSQPAGQELLAHELTHTVQQGAAVPTARRTGDSAVLRRAFWSRKSEPEPWDGPGRARSGAVSERVEDPETSDSQYGSPGWFDRNKTIYDSWDEDSRAPSGKTFKVSKGDRFKPLVAAKLYEPETDCKTDKDNVRWIKVVTTKGSGWVKEHATLNRVDAVHLRTVDPLIPRGTDPKPADVQQGSIGDCYLMAALITLAAQRPGLIRSMFSPAPDDVASPTVRVRFWTNLTPPGNGKAKWREDWIQVNKSVAKFAVDKDRGTFPDPYHKGPALWPAIVEKAYAVWLSQARTKKYGALDGGHGYQALQALTGEEHEARSLGKDQVERGSGKYTPALSSLFNDIEQALQSGTGLTLSTRDSWKGTDLDGFELQTGFSGNEPVKGGLVGRHEYGVLGAERRGELCFVRIRNPWGKYGQAYEEVEGKTKPKVVEGAEGAESLIELSDLPKHFSKLGQPKRQA